MRRLLEGRKTLLEDKKTLLSDNGRRIANPLPTPLDKKTLLRDEERLSRGMA
jgi:hypothetical protein